MGMCPFLDPKLRPDGIIIKAVFFALISIASPPFLFLLTVFHVHSIPIIHFQSPVRIQKKDGSAHGPSLLLSVIILQL